MPTGRQQPPANRAGSATSTATVPSSRTRKPTTTQELAVVQRQKREKEEAERKAALEQAEAEREAADERVQELERELQLSRDRESSLASTLDSMGHSSLALGGEISWSTDEARTLFSEEAAATARVDELITRVRSQRSCVRDMIAEQQNLSVTLGVS